MKSATTRACYWLAALLVVSPSAALATPPSGLVLFGFPDPIYDVGTIDQCEQLVELGYVVTLCFTLAMQVDGKGKYTGDATLEFMDDITGTLTGAASGKYSGKSGKEKGEFEVKKATGDLTFGTVTTEAQVDLSCSGPIDAGTLEGSCKIKVKIPGQGSASEKAEFSVPLGSFTYSILLDVVNVDDKKLEGTAADSFGFDYDVSGKYDSKKATSKLSAKGNKKDDSGNANPSQGAKFDIKNLDDLLEGEASAKVAGADFKNVFLTGTPLSPAP